MADPNPNKGTQLNFPAITAKLIAPGGVGPDIVWYRLWQSLWQRTGAQNGINGAALTQAANDQAVLLLTAQPGAKSAPPLPMALTVGSSPFTYVAPFAGTVVVSGGTVSATAFSRDGSTFITMPAGVVPVARGDQVKVTYSGLPTMTMIGS